MDRRYNFTIGTAQQNNGLKITGISQIEIQYQGAAIQTTIFCSPDLDKSVDCILSKTVLRQLGVVHETFPNRICSLSQPHSREENHPLKKAVNLLLTEFKDVFDDQTLKPMNIEPVKLHLKDDAPENPKRCDVPRKYPIHMKAAAERTEKYLTELGIIRPVTKPTKYCGMGFFVPKKSGDLLRLIADLTALNCDLKRSPHPIGDVESVLSEIDASAKYIILLDTKMGYYHVPIQPDSQDLTTFILPSGRHCYARAPQGLSVSSEEWVRNSEQAFKDVPGLVQLVDDLALFERDHIQLTKNLRFLLSQCRKHSITLNMEKVKILCDPGDAEIFIGHQLRLGKNGVEIHPDPSKLEAIRNFPQPKTPTDVKSFLGLACQLGQFHCDIQQCTSKMKELVKKENAFLWTPEINKEFTLAKKIISSDAVVRPYDPNLDTELYCDASRVGMGFILVNRGPAPPKKEGVKFKNTTQSNCAACGVLTSNAPDQTPSPNSNATHRAQDATSKKQLKEERRDKRPMYLVTCGSTTLSSAQKHYSTCEIEMSSVTWSLKKCHRYIFYSPRPIIVYTDHHALVSIFKKTLADLPNSRLQSLREKTLSYNIDVRFIPGKRNIMSDTLSRAPVLDGEEEFTKINPNFIMNTFATFIKSDFIDCDSTSLDNFAKTDDKYLKVIEAWRNQGATPFRNLPTTHPAQDYKSIWNDLSMQGELLVVNDKIVVPPSAIKYVLECLHANAHAGAARTKATARQLYFWLTLSRDIENMCANCDSCILTLPSQQAESLQQITVTQAAQLYASDIFTLKGKDHIILVDSFSNYLLCSPPLRSTTTTSIINQLNSWFITLGLCQYFRSDNALYYDSNEFDEFLARNGITPATSSPFFASSNGLSESNVKSAKHLMIRHDGYNAAFEQGLLEHNNMAKPHFSVKYQVSPAQLFFGRRLRTRLPALQSAFNPIDVSGAAAAKQEYDTKVKAKHDKRAKDLPPLNVNDLIYLQDSRTGLWSIKGKVVGKSDTNNRSYTIHVPSTDGTYRRNRRFLRLRHSEESQGQPMTADTAATDNNEGESKPRRSQRLANKTPSS